MEIHEIRRENLKRLIEDRFKTQRRLADAIGREANYISRILSGQKRLGEDLARHIENSIGLSKYWLDQNHNSEATTSAGDVESGPDLVSMVSVPIVGTAEGGPDRQWEELGYPVGYGSEYVDAPSRDPNAYALLVSGNSMAPRMRPGEAILVEPNHEPQPGDEVVVRMKDGSTMVKIFSARRGGRIYLDSIGDHDTIVAGADQIEFMHYVAGVFRAGSIRERQ